jgi:hypothetical protein
MFLSRYFVFYFYRVKDFEYTPECIIFDLLNIPLYHGWLVDPQCHETVVALGPLGYNQIVEKIILNKCSNKIDLVTEGEKKVVLLKVIIC